MIKVRLYKVFSIWESVIFIFFILFAVFLLFLYFNNNSINEKGIKALKNKDFWTAQKYFKQNIESGFLDNRSYLNLGLSYDFLDQPLKAFEIYKIVSSEKNRNMGVFFSYFNQAELYGRLGNLEKALQNYQSALEFGQKEKEIKTNIELLFKQKGQQGKGSDSKNQSSGSASDSQSETKSNQEQSEGDKGENQKNAEDEKSSEEDKKEDQNSVNGEDSFEENKTDNRDQSEESQSGAKKALTEREQKAILEEAQKQENKVRTRFYQNKKTFGDKTGKDW